MINILLSWLDAWSIIGLQYSTSASSWLWSSKHQNSWETLDGTQQFHEVYVTHGFLRVYWNRCMNTILRSWPMGWWAGSGLRALTHPASWLELGLCNPHHRGREPVPISCFLTSTYSITYVPSQKNVGKNWTMVLFIFDYRNLIIRLWVLFSSNVLAEQGSQSLVECGTLPKNQSTAKNIFKMY